ncbi:glutamate racemase [Patescibacteria group bacterium]|nr:glutamate racemase [Patescibacteria group bacterium]MBU1448905.1 glutamate racemase [Patescibacteria group bacterium]MBU2612989.1 glutamate racemase [Patescibacteria group bacterium]
MIGIFDSGIGGLTVVRELERQAPDVPFIYLGDTARTPYGNKSAETVIRYALEDVAFLVRQGATAIVIACNSASSVATDALRVAYPSIPVFEVITPAAEDALAATKGRIGVIGTRATITSGAYERHLSAQKVEVVVAACPLFVPLVEEGWLEDAETKRIARRYLSPLRKQQVDTLILGCTHYPLLAPIIRRYMGNRVTLVDSGTSVVRRVLAGLDASRPDLQAPRRFYLTDTSARSEEIAATWLGHPVTFERADLLCQT